MQKSRMPAFVAGAVVALVLGSGTAFAATGGKFILGRSNSASTVSTLSNGNGTALALRSKSGTPSLTVNTKARVPNFNADMLDGLHSSSFARTSGKTAYFESTGYGLDTDGDGLDDTFAAEAYCPPGTIATGGGIVDMTQSSYSQLLNAPDVGNAWVTAVLIDPTAADDPSLLAADVVCYSPTGAGLQGSAGLAKRTSQPLSDRAVEVVRKAASARLSR